MIWNSQRKNSNMVEDMAVEFGVKWSDRHGCSSLNSIPISLDKLKVSFYWTNGNCLVFRANMIEQISL
ncbi:hypothetical protein H5410_014421 [Solanum commersonii]|uniref:Uncharacterized protein n=1 Tax=Solanum commersonii TaxID=4109 RepID=A0A9J5ZQV5_SOLCO|nr:hypothetical protein H5410_014421 [Solanum commersonii]